jgi:sodium-dependent dicarboxylate transporter 2/3/5
MARISTDRNGPRPPLAFAVAAAIGVAGGIGCWMSGQLPAEGSVTFGTFLMTGLLWVSGAVPSHLAGLAGAAILAAAIPTGLLAAGSRPSVPWIEVARQAVSPAVAMTLAGMMLALGAARTGMDRVIAERLLGPTLHRPAALLGSVLASGALLSMFMSNTATAVLLLAIVVPIVAPMGRESPAARAVVLAAALGAAVGGLATPIGTSPNVIAYGLIRDAGLEIGFLEWAATGLPIAVTVLLCGALALRSLAGGFHGWKPPARAHALPRPGLAGWAWCAVFLTTVALWSTQQWTTIPIERASLIPIVALPALGLVRTLELRAIDWRTLLLLFAGLVLGSAMGRTGVAAWLVGWSVPASAPDAVVVASFCAVSIALSTVMSNTATANLIVPMALAVGNPALALPCALASALGSSLAIGLPVSTPPMLLAHATGFVRPRELAWLGVIVGVLGTIAVTASIHLR